MPISININIDKIDKDRFFKGKKGRYLDLTLFETPESEYGDYLVKQSAKKGEKMPILGNGKYFKLKGETNNERGTDDDEIRKRGDDPW